MTAEESLKECSVCDLCGKDYRIDLLIDNSLWEKYVSKGHYIIMCCPHCIINAIDQSGKNYAFTLIDLSKA